MTFDSNSMAAIATLARAIEAALTTVCELNEQPYCAALGGTDNRIWSALFWIGDQAAVLERRVYAAFDKPLPTWRRPADGDLEADLKMIRFIAEMAEENAFTQVTIISLLGAATRLTAIYTAGAASKKKRKPLTVPADNHASFNPASPVAALSDEGASCLDRRTRLPPS